MSPTRNDTGIQKVTPDVTMPDYLKNQDTVGIETMNQFVTPPSLKIIQKQSRDELLARWSKGDVIMMPTESEVVIYNEAAPVPFWFTPLFFYTEYATWTPRDLQGSLPAVVDRTLDPTSPLAKKARDKATWSEKGYEYTKADGSVVKFEARHIEHLVFVAVLQNHALSGIPFVMSFEKAEHRTGSNLCSQIKMRKTSPFNCIFQASVGVPRKNEKGSWYGLDISNPDPAHGVAPWVTEEQSTEFKKVYEDTKKVFEEGRLRADINEADAATGEAVSDEDAAEADEAGY